jgi:hypothetical protein
MHRSVLLRQQRPRQLTPLLNIHTIGSRSSRYLSSAAAPAASAASAATTPLSSSKKADTTSTTIPVAASLATATSFRLPIKHSSKKLPSVCTDPVQLAELTASILQAPEGSLYKYKDVENSNASVSKEERVTAWEAADQVVQKVEYLIRGHAHTLEGTQWNRWLSGINNGNSSSGDPTATLETMQALMDRMEREGRMFTTMRSLRLEELHGPKRQVVVAKVVDPNDTSDVKKGSLENFLYGDEQEEEDENEYKETEEFQDIEALQKDIEKFAREEGETVNADEERMHVVQDGKVQEDHSSHATTQTQQTSYMNDFASPGVTVNMYDTLLDAMACQAASEFVTSQKAFDILAEVIARHDLDGGDDKNTNIHTRPTAVSYNAAIRIASELPFDMESEEPEDICMRDDALTVAFGAFDALYQSGVERNSATYGYLLLTVAKYMPASRTRGNVARGMFHHAQEQGLIDADVVAAQTAANTPSNGPEFDEWMDKTLKDKTVNDLPHAWRRFSKVRRHHPREAIY